MATFCTLTAHLKIPRPFVKDGVQMKNATHLDPNFNADIEGNIDFPA
jgi:hypothetical protein